VFPGVPGALFSPILTARSSNPIGWHTLCTSGNRNRKRFQIKTMRALYTQFSFLVGFLAVFEFMSLQVTSLVAVALGTATACTVYLVLLLGDFTIHRFLEEKASAPSSIRILNPLEDTTNADFQTDEAIPSLDEPAVRAA
jgi:hypothetical protein